MRSPVSVLRAFFCLGFLGALPIIASVVGIGAGVNSLMNSGGGQGGTSGSSAPPSAPYYQPMGQGLADQSWLNAMNQTLQGQTQAAGQIQPAISGAYQNMLGIDPSQYLQSASAAGGQYGNLSNLAQMYQQILGGQAGQSMGAQQNLYNAGNQAFSAGQDPQQQLYNQMLQQTQDQSRAATSMRGIGTSPESAGIENQSVNQFNMDWQNQQLARMLSGLQGMTGAYQGAGAQGQLTGANLSGAMGFGAQAPQFTMQGGSTPYQAQQNAYSYPITASDQYGSSLQSNIFAPYGQMQNQAIPYLNYGSGQTQGQFGQFNQAQGTQNAQNAAGLGLITNGMGQLGMQANNPGSWLNTAFGGGSNPFASTGVYSGADQSLAGY